MCPWIKKKKEQNKTKQKKLPLYCIHAATVHVLTNVSVMEPCSQHQTNSSAVHLSVHRPALIKASCCISHSAVMPSADLARGKTYGRRTVAALMTERL